MKFSFSTPHLRWGGRASQHAIHSDLPVLAGEKFLSQFLVHIPTGSNLLVSLSCSVEMQSTYLTRRSAVRHHTLNLCKSE